jgi:hypothetical protein
MPYNNERDILIRRDETDWASPISPTSGRVEELWRVMSPVAVKNPLHPWDLALNHARAHAKRTGGNVYRKVGNATPERVEPAR